MVARRRIAGAFDLMTYAGLRRNFTPLLLIRQINLAIFFKPSREAVFQIAQEIIKRRVLGLAFPDHTTDVQCPNHRPAIVVLAHLNPTVGLNPLGSGWIGLLKGHLCFAGFRAFARWDRRPSFALFPCLCLLSHGTFIVGRLNIQTPRPHLLRNYSHGRPTTSISRAPRRRRWRVACSAWLWLGARPGQHELR